MPRILELAVSHLKQSILRVNIRYFNWYQNLLTCSANIQQDRRQWRQEVDSLQAFLVYNFFKFFVVLLFGFLCFFGLLCLFVGGLLNFGKQQGNKFPFSAPTPGNEPGLSAPMNDNCWMEQRKALETLYEYSYETNCLGYFPNDSMIKRLAFLHATKVSPSHLTQSQPTSHDIYHFFSFRCMFLQKKSNHSMAKHVGDLVMLLIQMQSW